ncbi:phage antirepressor Ant [Bacteroides sp. 4_1_36]|nr:phage antirepressor Ant [Bacteroides sp. 4_1_36]
MNHQNQVFNHPQFGEICTVQQEEGKVLFKANDVARSLGYAEAAKAVRTHCKGGSVLDTPIENQYGTVVMQPTKFISESDVYRLVMRSKLPEAEKFQDWVCEEVLPAIRKDGAYLSEKALQRAVTDPEFFIGLANAIRKEKEQRLEIESCCTEQQLLIDRQKETIEELGKRSAYAETVLQNKDLVDITQIAQDYGLSGRRLNAILHEKRVQYKSGKQWILYAPYKGNGYVGSETSQLENGKTVMRTRWTQKGRLFIHDLLKADGILPVHEIETEQTETSSNIQ